jgi:hypothetical protein
MQNREQALSYKAIVSSTATPMALLEVIVIGISARLFNDQSFPNAG